MAAFHSHFPKRPASSLRLNRSAPVTLQLRPATSPCHDNCPPVPSSPSEDSLRLARDSNAHIISEIIGPKTTLSKLAFQKILHRLYLFDHAHLIQTFAKNAEGTEFDAIGLKKLLIRTADGRPADVFEETIRTRLIVGLSNLRARERRSQSQGQCEVVLTGKSGEAAVLQPSDFDGHDSSTSYDEVDEPPAPRAPEPRPVSPKKVHGEGYLPRFYDRLIDG
jgi:hypothetical protein